MYVSMYVCMYACMYVYLWTMPMHQNIIITMKLDKNNRIKGDYIKSKLTETT